eukprot:TRINITY_DN5509_c0_g1_i16.p1 TRINITY_DN5509_c0_g1~~TRINITY_DN5509_c0_g1_i16.p1  ORF type:complete len:335 (+),score=63.86 TRINITY_DN5509_c0_g1_i16:51-1055(+)
MSDTNSVLLGFGLSLAAGLSTCFGSLAPYMTDLKNTRFLAASLAISAGVMLYVSFAEIIFKARDFMEESMSDAGAAWLSTFCFFLGIALCWALNEMAHRLEEWERNRNGDGQSHLLHDSSQESDAEIGSSHEMTTRGENVDSETQFDGHTSHRSPASNLLEVGEHESSMKLSEERSKELRTMGLMTALAIAIHNFPEGIATYVAAQADASLGIAMAVAIALHNIPEGVCVSIPIYYATGNIKDALSVHLQFFPIMRHVSSLFRFSHSQSCVLCDFLYVVFHVEEFAHACLDLYQGNGRFCREFQSRLGHFLDGWFSKMCLHRSHMVFCLDLWVA